MPVPHQLLLASLAQYLTYNPHTLLTRIYGLYTMGAASGKQQTFIVMSSVFASELRVHEQYDLKVRSTTSTIEVHTRKVTSCRDPP